MNVAIEVDGYSVLIDYAMDGYDVLLVVGEDGEVSPELFLYDNQEAIDVALEVELRKVGEREKEAYQYHTDDLDEAYARNNGGW